MRSQDHASNRKNLDTQKEVDKTREEIRLLQVENVSRVVALFCFALLCFASFYFAKILVLVLVHFFHRSACPRRLKLPWMTNSSV